MKEQLLKMRKDMEECNKQKEFLEKVVQSMRRDENQKNGVKDKKGHSTVLFVLVFWIIKFGVVSYNSSSCLSKSHFTLI